MRVVLQLVLLTFLGACSMGGRVESERSRLDVAVAANFIHCARILAPEFERTHDCEVVFSVGSTGRLAKQIEEGAPFAVFLAADVRRPRLLVESGLAEAGSRFTYAQGLLTLAVPKGRPAPTSFEGFRPSAGSRVALARPELAPYGLAAEEALASLGVDCDIVYGENVGQVLHYLVTGAADFGFVPLSLAESQGLPRIAVPRKRHQPITQQAVLVDTDSDLARRFLDYLRSASARETILRCGYEQGS